MKVYMLFESYKSFISTDLKVKFKYANKYTNLLRFTKPEKYPANILWVVYTEQILLC